MKTIFKIILPLFLITTTAMAEEVQQVGRGAAVKYFQKNQDTETTTSSSSSSSSDKFEHYLAVYYGHYMSSQSYDWGKYGQENDVGNNAFGLTYRVGEWLHSMDLGVRVEYADYKVGGESPSKMSFMPLITFPDANSRFPLYFGAGAGLGVFFKQTNSKSALSLDYTLVAGARFFDIFENTGFFVEAGIKNSLFLLSTGQLNGTFLAGGLVFTF